MYAKKVQSDLAFAAELKKDAMERVPGGAAVTFLPAAAGVLAELAFAFAD